MRKVGTRRPMLFSRVDPEEFEEAQKVADELYDGNLSLLVRLSVRRTVEQHKVDKTDSEAAA